MAMLPLLVPIEILSYCVRPISLSVRLFGNMMAGHTMLKVFAGFIVSLGAYFVVPGIAPLAITVVLIGFEFAGRLPAGLHLHRPYLHLPQRRDPHALRA